MSECFSRLLLRESHSHHRFQCIVIHRVPKRRHNSLFDIPLELLLLFHLSPHSSSRSRRVILREIDWRLLRSSSLPALLAIVTVRPPAAPSIPLIIILFFFVIVVIIIPVLASYGGSNSSVIVLKVVIGRPILTGQY